MLYKKSVNHIQHAQAGQRAYKDRAALAVLLLVYALIYLPAMFADWANRAFMDIDPQSIMYSIDGLTTAPYYNMNAHYHSQFYGWTYFSLHFVAVMVLKMLGLANEVSVNFTARAILFLIGAFIVFHAFRLCRNFLSVGWSAFCVFAFITNPVSAHFFITIHPESLGLLLQIIGIRFLVAVYRSPNFSRPNYFLAIAFLCLGALCKQPFVITGGLIFVGFLICQARRNCSSGMKLPQLSILALQTGGVAIAVLFLIHPYAILEPFRFYEAQMTLMRDHSPMSFGNVAPQWAGVVLSNFIVLTNFILVPICLLLPRSYFFFKISLLLTAIAAFIFIFQARLIVRSTYIYPAYGFLFFNATYFFAQVLWPRIKAKFGVNGSLLLFAVLLSPVVLVFGSNIANSAYQSHAKYFLDGRSTSHRAWGFLSEMPPSTRIAYSPNVAILDPLKKTGCHAWQGCADARMLEAFDPDFLVFSPKYAHFQSKAYLEFVRDQDFQLVAEIKPDVSIDLACGKDPGLSIIKRWVEQLKNVAEFFPANIASCASAYRAAFIAMRAGAIVAGLPIEIYGRAKNSTDAASRKSHETP